MTYVDPVGSDWPELNLIDGLISKPTTETKSPLEDQTTVVLAWLLDRWPALARAFATMCFADDHEALAALDSATVVRARTWLSLPKLPCSPGGGLMRPDLSLVGDRRSFELIVENKVSASPHHYECLNGCHAPLVVQQEAYALAWALCPADQEAEVRRVSVLSRDSVERGDIAELRGQDVLWTDVREVMSELLDGDLSDAALAVIASDFRDVIDERVLAQTKPAVIGAAIDADSHPVLIWGAELLAHLLPVLGAGLGGRHSGPLLNSRSLYAGGYLRFPARDGSELSLWFCVTEEGRPYAAPGFSDGLWIVRDGSWPSRALDVLRAAGFVKHVDNAGYPNLRVHRSAAELRAQGDASEIAAMLADELMLVLRRAAQ